MTKEKETNIGEILDNKDNKKARKTKEEKKQRPPGKIHLFFERVSRIAGNRYFGNMAVQAGIVSCVLLLFIEALGHKSFWGGLQFLVENPFGFLLNAMLIFVTLTPAWLFRHRTFFYALIATPWLIIGIANGVVLNYRMTPFTTADLQIIDMGIDLLPNYFTNVQVVLLGIGALVVLALYVLLFRFGPKHRTRPNYKRVGAAFLLSVLLVVGSWNLGIKINAVSLYFENLWDAYYHFGVPYCFLNTWLNKGVRKPANYSEQTVDALFQKGALDKMSSAEGKSQKDFPNIVFLQLESFIDPEEVKGLSFSRPPVPFFKELKEKYSSGYLTVPVVGGGTANTEFEVQSGVSMQFFGPGEYPYKSVLKKNTCETMAYDLKRMGYGTHIIHNHRGSFYNRNTVFPHLGYDDFTSLEYMNYVFKTPKNWATDDVLRGEIIGAMESTAAKDYVYTISVQGHGEYPKKRIFKTPDITVKGAKTKELEYSYEYYVQEISEMDSFVKQLTEELSDFGEDVVLVIYGDHLPAMDIKRTEVKSGSTFKTQYVIWANFDLEKQDKDLEAFQLAAEVQARIGMREGTLTAYHQDQMGKKNYLQGLHLLQYDILYGNRYIYGGKNPFPPTDMKMGYLPITIKEIVEVAGQYYISGEGFTPFSKVSLDGKVLDTIYTGPTVIKLIDEVDPSDVPRLKVSQVEKNNSILSTTE